MPTLRTGEKISWKELYHRWKKGMKEVTPLQQCITIQLGHIISGIGVIWGIIFSIRIGYYWMCLILIGGMIVLSVQYLGNYQKKMVLKEVEKQMKEVENGHR